MGTVYEAEDEVLGRRVAVKRLKSSGRLVPAPLLARGSRRGAAQPPERLPALRGRRGQPGASSWRWSSWSASPSRSASQRGRLMTPAETVSLGAGMLAALLGPPRRRHRPPGPQALERLPHRPRGAASRLRPRAGAARRDPRAAALDSSGDRTHPDLLVGSPRYMAPEQILGKDVDARTDVFAAGAVLYEALAGRPAFAGATLVEILTATLHDAPPPLDGRSPRRSTPSSVGRWPRSPPIASRRPRRWRTHCGRPRLRPAGRRAPRRPGGRRRTESREVFAGRDRRARAARGSLRGRALGRRQRGVRDRRARHGQVRSRGCFPETRPRRHGARHRRHRTLHGAAGTRGDLPALSRRLRALPLDPGPRRGSRSHSHVGADGGHPDARGARPRPRRFSSPPARRGPPASGWCGRPGTSSRPRAVSTLSSC